MTSPENTLIALKKAVNQGAQCVEFDVMLTRDGVPIVMHDETVDRTTNGSGRVCDLDSAEIAVLDAGSWFSDEFSGETVPTLAEWLQCASQLRCSLNIEMKARSNQAMQLAESVNRHLQQYWQDDLPKPLISSASKPCLRAMHRVNPEAQLGYICQYWPIRPVWLLRRLHCVSLHVYYKRLTPSRIQKIRDSGFEVLAFTVNNPDDIEKFLAWGLTGVFSDI